MLEDTEEEEDYRDYFRKVELGWSLARGCQIIVSPIEFEEMEKWYESGIPLPVVLRAIEVFIEKKRRAKRQRSYLLKDVAGTVEKCWREYQDIHAGEGEEGDLLLSKMKTLVGKVRKLASPWPQADAFIKELVTRLRAIDLAEISDFDSLDRDLEALDAALVDHFMGILADDELAEIRDDVSEFLEEHEDPDFFKKMLSDAIRAHFTLPKLSLLG